MFLSANFKIAYLVKNWKVDFKLIAIELEVNVEEASNVIDLRNLIMRRSNYQKDFVNNYYQL